MSETEAHACNPSMKILIEREAKYVGRAGLPNPRKAAERQQRSRKGHALQSMVRVNFRQVCGLSVPRGMSVVL